MHNFRILLLALAATCSLPFAACGGMPASAGPRSAGPAPAPAPAPGGFAIHFDSPAAQWLYRAPQGSGLAVGSMTGGLPFSVNAHDGGFDYPVEETDGSHGCTTFTDNGADGTHQRLCVPNPADGGAGFAPSHGGWGANDGHLVVVNTATGDYYDFWKLTVDGSGRPTSTEVGRLAHGQLASSDGTPGTTAALITGLAGDILPGELDCDTCLNHALNVVVPSSMNSNQMGRQAPAGKTDGTEPGAVFREGAKIRLDPGFDIGSLHASTAARAILRALQLYGGVITDQTGGRGISFYSALAATPDLGGMQPAAAHLWIYY